MPDTRGFATTVQGWVIVTQLDDEVRQVFGPYEDREFAEDGAALLAKLFVTHEDGRVWRAYAKELRLP